MQGLAQPQPVDQGRRATRRITWSHDAHLYVGQWWNDWFHWTGHHISLSPPRLQTGCHLLGSGQIHSFFGKLPPHYFLGCILGVLREESIHPFRSNSQEWWTREMGLKVSVSRSGGRRCSGLSSICDDRNFFLFFFIFLLLLLLIILQSNVSKVASDIIAVIENGHCCLVLKSCIPDVGIC